MSQSIGLSSLSSRESKVVTGLTLLVGLVLVLVGCAIRETAQPAPAVVSPAPPPVPAGPSVAPLPDGRSGFVIREVPNRPEEWQSDFTAAIACLDRQDYAEAIGLLQQVITHEPGVTAPYIDIALAYWALGESEPAEANLKKALELFPAHPVAGNAYGLLLRSEGRFEEARTAYQEVLAQFPDYAPAHRNLGILCDLYLDNLECALAHYELYSAADPGDEQVKLWLVDLHQRLGN